MSLKAAAGAAPAQVPTAARGLRAAASASLVQGKGVRSFSEASAPAEGACALVLVCVSVLSFMSLLARTKCCAASPQRRRKQNRGGGWLPAFSRGHKNSSLDCIGDSVVPWLGSMGHSDFFLRHFQYWYKIGNHGRVVSSRYISTSPQHQQRKRFSSLLFWFSSFVW